MNNKTIMYRLNEFIYSNNLELDYVQCSLETVFLTKRSLYIYIAIHVLIQCDRPVCLHDVKTHASVVKRTTTVAIASGLVSCGQNSWPSGKS